MTSLAAVDLAKHYRRRAVVNGVSLEINSGEVVGLLGPNGAGKTTCFYMIAGLIPLMYASGAGAQQRFSIGIVIVAGCIIGTFLEESCSIGSND